MRAILRDVWWSYRMHDGRLLSGALAFYFVMAATPFGVIALYVGGLLLGEDEVRATLIERVRTSAGDEVATFASDSLDVALAPQHGALATAISILFILYVTSRLFHMLRASLNHLWGVRPTIPWGFRGRGRQVLKRRVLASVMVFVAIGIFVLFALLRAGMVIAAAWTHFAPLVRVGELFGSIAALTLMIALVFRWLPDAEVAWRDAFAGGLLTAVLAGVGSQLTGLYLANVGVSSSYGAAGSVVLMTLWVYYTCQIFFFGAEFTAAYARHHGSGIEPLDYATRVVVERHAIEDEA